MDRFEALQSSHHGISAFETSSHCVGGKLASAAVGHDHQRSQKTQEYLCYQRADKEPHARARGAFLVIASVALQEGIDQEPDDSRKEDDEGI